MILTPHISHQTAGIVWRMEIDPLTDTLFAEVRNEGEKQVGFTSVSLSSGKVNFSGLTTGERWLTGMEAAYNGVLLLHHYASPGSPTHKAIIAIDAQTGQALWSNYNLTFDHLSTAGPVVFDTRIQPRKLFTIDITTGATLGSYQPSVSQDVANDIVLPDMLSADSMESALPEKPYGNIVHQLWYNWYRIVSLHALKNNTLSQALYIFKGGQQVFTDLLHTGIQKLQPEAFVLHKHYLIYLKNKGELMVINLGN
ncbi:DUF4905 domain-containing protein [Mucilaginibacter mali]|uniref:DUF4905 domain-containing protein n=1 Tax=Mucilaginibacter mali TaxID=2740462 RepID=A0A7D4UER7_9SPHI|nr:DUF4905 domain-containing protein [Mucilaginibacter mali]QKJ29296.1 DUF4905 domain-containing protein [Mucilaginibacter mali]